MIKRKELCTVSRQSEIILIYKMLACVCMCVFQSVHADFSAMLSPFGEFEVLLEPARQGHAVF